MEHSVQWENLHVPRKNIKSLLAEGKVFKSAYDWELTKKDKEKARVELGETDEKKERCLHELKEKLLMDKKFKFRNDDFYLLRFLRIRKFNCNKSYESMKKVYHMREQKPIFFTFPSNLKHMLDRNFLSILPYTDEEGRAILWWQPGLCNPDDKSCDEMIQLVTMVLDILTLNPKLQINGVIGAWDSDGLTINHFLQIIKNNRAFTLLSFAQTITAWRIHKCVVVNTGRITRLIYSLVRPLIRSKIADRVFLLGSDTSELHQHLDPLILPKKLGGALEEEDCQCTEYIENNIPYLQYERSFGSK